MSTSVTHLGCSWKGVLPMTATIHDSGYKRLFSNKTIFRQLFETFVEEEWMPQLDFERAERLDKSFVSEHCRSPL